MGISGIYRELGPGQRVALSKLAADTLKTSNRPFRLAIDIAIWQFQAQAAKGGANPAIRLLFYRLVRLMGTPIQPVFVFDGPNKPAIKRNKRSSKGDNVGVAIGLAKRMIRLFGFVIHDAPGEAEAECALLQQRDIVDAVLSEDVDTIMFGCTKTLRNWSAESKSAKTPTHVSMYDVDDPAIKKTGLDREGMVLVALMSGGDYIPEGIPGCGIKVAYQAAVAGFGKTICRLRTSDKEGIRAWRENLIHELKTNESKFFRTRHKGLEIPDTFPILEVLRYYTHPVVSRESDLEVVRQKLAAKEVFQLEGLRDFTRETFDWVNREGALKYTRVLGEALLVRKLQHEPHEAGFFVKRITTSRKHASTDGALEFRLTYIPEEIVPLDLSQEVATEISYSREGLATNSDDEFDEPNTVESSQTPKWVTNPFDASKPELAWVLEEVARKAVPDLVRAWEDKEHTKAVRKAPAKKSSGSKTKKTGQSSGMPFGAMNQFVRTTKASAASDRLSQSTKEAPSSQFIESSPARPTMRRSQTPPPREPSKQPTAPSTPTAAGVFASSQVTPRPTKSTGQQAISLLSSPPAAPEPILISSSPVCAAASPPSSPSPRRRIPLSRIEESPSSVDNVLSAARASRAVSKERRTPTKRRAAPSMFSSPAKSPSRALRQTSMDMYAKKLFSPVKPKEPTNVSSSAQQTSLPTPVEDDADDESFIDLTPDSPVKKRSREALPVGPSPGPRRKRLLIPVLNGDGFFDELDVSLAERDIVAAKQAAASKERGVRSRVLRWSDLTMIDLTQPT